MHRLGLNLPTNGTVEVSVPLLLQSYREKYPADPVTEQDFGQLVERLRRKDRETDHQNTPKPTTAHAGPQGPSATKQVSPLNNIDEHETIDERDGNSGPQATNVFAEFVKGWRNLMSNNDASRKRPQRKLDVLSWGFGE